MVLNELCCNAMVHGLRGGGTLTIEAREGTDANVSAGVSGKTVVIEVADSGRGGGTTAIMEFPLPGGEH
jgi:two-component sensor histidine kinase